MMSTMSSVGTEAFSHRERISSLTSMMRDHKAAVATTESLQDKLLGLSASPCSLDEARNDLNDLDEEDVWDTEEVGEDDDDEAWNNNGSRSDINGGGMRRWVGFESVDSGYGLAALSPLVSNNSKNWENGEGLRKQHHGSTASTRMLIPQAISSDNNGRTKVLQRQQSAPVNVPDWSKILGAAESNNNTQKGGGLFDFQDEDVEEGEEKLPPHELVARDYARSHIMTFSVYEGAGHTLKGRDLSRVRNAVLKQTGFL